MSRQMTKKEIVGILSRDYVYLRNKYDGKVYKPKIGDDFLKLIEGGFPDDVHCEERYIIDVEYQDIYCLPDPTCIHLKSSSLGQSDWSAGMVELEFLFHLSINDIFQIDALNEEYNS